MLTLTGCPLPAPLTANLMQIGEQRTLRLPLSGNCQMGAPALVVSDDGYFK